MKYNDDPDMGKLLKQYQLSRDWRIIKEEFWRRKEDDEKFQRLYGRIALEDTTEFQDNIYEL